MKSDEEKKLSGHYRKERSKTQRGNEIRLPKCTHPISNKAKKFRRVVFEYLKLHGVAYKVDFFVLDKFAWVYDCLDTAIEKVGFGANVKLVQTFKSGVRQISPEVSVFNILDKKFDEYCRKFGITPKYRQDIENLVGEMKDETDEGYIMKGLAVNVNNDLVWSDN